MCLATKADSKRIYARIYDCYRQPKRRCPLQRSRPNTLRGVFKRIDHIGVAVEQLEPALELYRDSFELELAHREVVEEQGVEAVITTYKHCQDFDL